MSDKLAHFSMRRICDLAGLRSLLALQGIPKVAAPVELAVFQHLHKTHGPWKRAKAIARERVEGFQQHLGPKAASVAPQLWARFEDYIHHQIGEEDADICAELLRPYFTADDIAHLEAIMTDPVLVRYGQLRQVITDSASIPLGRAHLMALQTLILTQNPPKDTP